MIALINKLMNRFKLYMLFCAIALMSCKKDVIEPDEPNETSNKIISHNISEDTIWASDTVYQLRGRISVTDGAILTIQAGTIIKGESGSGSGASCLIISQGCKIIANGTEDKPIIFTSVADDIVPSDIEVGITHVDNLNETISGLWGGLIILGNAPISASNQNGNVSQVQIEGIPTSDTNGLYGGSNIHDNSGILRYVSIRHGGTNIGSGNEINGLTLGGVGDQTVIENIEIVANQDDGIEFFGGTVNVSNVLVWNVGDDAIDTDQAWGGQLHNFIIISPQGHCFELDGPEGSSACTHTISQGHIVCTTEQFTAMDLINTDDNSFVQLIDLYFTRVSEDQKINRVVHETGNVEYDNIFINVTEDSLQDHINGSIPSGIHAGDTMFVTVNDFEWTWAYQSNNINL
jgi:hypothetical protein